jgi:hypothetical protein
VKSELIKSYELGFKSRFFENRLGVDFTWYRSNATRQLIDIPLDPLSGYSNKKVNAGNIQNTGIELIVDADIIRNLKSFKWNLQANFSRNNNVVKELAPDISKYVLGGYDNVNIDAIAGRPYGEIYGTRFKRVDDKKSSHNGELLLDGNGLPQQDPDKVLLGNQQPDFLLGITSTFHYKGVSLSFLIDGRFGGKMFSTTVANMEAVGTSALTAPDGKRKKLTVPGVIKSGDNYKANNDKITPQQYWEAVQPGNIGVTEANLYDATNIRLRNVELSYALPTHIFRNTPIRSANVGFTFDNVWMINSHMHGVDPESVYSTGTNATGFENSSPPTARRMLFNVNLSF